MRCEVLTDMELVRQTITHPMLYRHMTDDGSPIPEAYRPPGALYVGVFDERFLGMLAFVPLNAAMCEIHVILLPSAWGRSSACVAEAIRWFWNNTTYLRVIASVPSYHRLALRLARECGFEQYGVNPLSWKKGGKLYNLIMLGVSKCQ